MIEIKIREGLEEDIPFVFNTWLGVMRGETPRWCPNEVFFDKHKKLVEAALINSQTLVACSPDDKSQIFGFIVGGKKHLHYCHTKAIFRKMKIATRLMDAMLQKGTIVFSQYAFGMPLIKHHRDFIYDPYPFYKGEPYEIRKEN